MFSFKKVLAAAVFCFSLLTSFAHAQAINFTYEGFADFTINGMNSSNVAFEISADADSSNVMANLFNPDLLFLNHDSATIDLGALGLFTITDPTSTFLNQSNGLLGVGTLDAANTEFSMVADPSLVGYDLASAFGPEDLIVDTNFATFDASDATGNSTIVFDNFIGAVTFTANGQAIPEPTTFCMIALSGIGFATYRRRRR